MAVLNGISNSAASAVRLQDFCCFCRSSIAVFTSTAIVVGHNIAVNLNRTQPPQNLAVALFLATMAPSWLPVAAPSSNSLIPQLHPSGTQYFLRTHIRGLTAS